MGYRNGEGYADPTAGAAMSLVMKEYRQKQKQRFLDRHRKKIYVASKYAGDIQSQYEGSTETLPLRDRGGRYAGCQSYPLCGIRDA